MLKPLSVALGLGLAAAAIAGGPLVLEGPNGNIPAAYLDPSLQLNIETGPLGVRTNDAADQLVRDALAIWNTIATSSIKLSQGDDVPVDINFDNFTTYIPVPGSSTIQNDEDGLNPIVFDSDGSIIDAYFGDGQSATVVGFAASSIIIGSRFFTEGFAVINGSLPLTSPSDEQLILIIAHEIGHLIGLDHSQADISNVEALFEARPPFTFPSCSTAPADDYPLMYPYACRGNRVTHPDDDVAVSTLYPAADFFQNQAQLTGTFLTTDGAPVKGANLWVRNTQINGAVYSIVSDYLTQCTGFFAFMLPPGQYILHANSINREFYEGSSVGPYANSPFDLSFQPPASDIGADLLFRADGTLPAIINLEAGKSTEVVFRTDGTGSITPSDTQVDLAQIYSSADACPAVDNSGGGGSPALPLLAALLLIPVFRARANRPR